MKTFKTVEWEDGNVGDQTCKELLLKGPKKSRKVMDKKEKRKQQKSKKELKVAAFKSQLHKENIKESPNVVKRIFKPPIIQKRRPETKSNTEEAMTSIKHGTKLKKRPDAVKEDLKGRKTSKIKEKVRESFHKSQSHENQKRNRGETLRERMLTKLKSARFRYLNEQMYSNDGKEAQKIFAEDPEAFEAYHEGYRQQVQIWPMNPLDIIIKSIEKMSKTFTIADFGCGEAKLAQSVTQKVHSFDLVALNGHVTACNMAHVPLSGQSIDVVVFCLSLMGTNLHEYLLEANRVLKNGGILKIAEVESRFDNVNNFIEGVQRYNFKLTWNDLSNNLFYFMDFKKEANVKNKKKLPTIGLNPCLYKRR